MNNNIEYLGSIINKIKKYIADNIWNILGIVVGLGGGLAGLISFFVSRVYSIKCSEYYGVSEKYFVDYRMFLNKMIILVLSVIWIVCPIIFSCIIAKWKNKKIKIVFFVLMIFILFEQNIIFS